MLRFTVPTTLPGLNDYIVENRRNKHAGNAMSQRAHRDCKIGMIPLNGKRICSAFFIFHWIEKDRRRDKDNIAMAKKFILDSLQEWGVLKNDGWKQVLGFIDIFSVDKINPRVEVSLLTPEEFSRGIHVYPKKDTIHVKWEE